MFVDVLSCRWSSHNSSLQKWTAFSWRVSAQQVPQQQRYRRYCEAASTADTTILRQWLVLFETSVKRRMKGGKWGNKVKLTVWRCSKLKTGTCDKGSSLILTPNPGLFPQESSLMCSITHICMQHLKTFFQVKKKNSTHLYIKPMQQTTQARTITPRIMAAVPAGEPPEAVNDA